MPPLRFSPEAEKYLNERLGDEAGVRDEAIALLAEIMVLFRDGQQFPLAGSENVEGLEEGDDNIFCNTLSTDHGVVYRYPVVFDSGEGVLIVAIEPAPTVSAESSEGWFLSSIRDWLFRIMHRPE
jgi:hypothetical protein